MIFASLIVLDARMYRVWPPERELELVSIFLVFAHLLVLSKKLSIPV